MHTPLVSCLAIYLADPKPFYVDHMDKLHVLASYMLDRDELAALPRFYGELAPDLCLGCTRFYGLTEGGRLRHGCASCPENIRWIDTLAAWTNWALIEDTLKLHRDCVEYHAAIAYGLILQRRKGVVVWSGCGS